MNMPKNPTTISPTITLNSPITTSNSSIDTPDISPKILAISGGIDSMVMLDIFAHIYPAKDLIVAHFNHNIRLDSDLDQIFVKQKAAEYSIKFITKTAPSRILKSEASARSVRYQFLEELAKKYHATIFTAQHVDDLIESILINLIRGTGWRGLAAMNRKNIFRPFLDQTFLQNNFSQTFQIKIFQKNFSKKIIFSKKNQKNNFSQKKISNFFPKNKNSQIIVDKKWIFAYAAVQNLTWREDSTNSENIFLRNRVRELLAENPLPKNLKSTLLKLSSDQKNIAAEIDQIFSSLELDKNLPRTQFTKLDNNIAYELLRFICGEQGITFTSSDIAKLLFAIRTYAPNKTVNLSKNRLVKIHKNHFQLP